MTSKPFLALRLRTVPGLLLLCLLLLSTASSSSGQAVDSTLVARYQLAESYLRAAQFDRAIRLFEDLYATSPDTRIFYDKLKTSYESVKRYDDAIALVDARMERDPNRAGLLSDKGRLLYLMGEEEAAFTSWEQAVKADPVNPTVYILVYRSLMELRLFERAIEILIQGRLALNTNQLFQTDLAYLYSLTGEHEQAMEEYLSLLRDNDRQLSFVRGRLARYSDQEEAMRATVAVVERGVRADPLNRSFRELLSWLYLETGQYRKAFDTNRAIDRLEQEEGRVLFAFAQQASDAGAYDVALDAYEEILKRYPDSATAPEAMRGLGQMHERRAEKLGERAIDEDGNPKEAPHYERALAVFNTFVETYPNHAYFPDVLRRIGRLHQDIFLNLDEASSILNEVVNRFPQSVAADQAEFDLGRIALQRDQLDVARLTFSRLEERLRTGDLAEAARYELALIHFYQGEFDAAFTVTQAMQENTSADVANDAIELKVLLFESKGPDSLNTPLRLYAGAHLLKRQHRSSAALQTLNELLDAYGQHALADDVRFLRASLLRDMGQYQEARTAFGELPLIHPTSFLADRSLFNAAEILEQNLGNEEAAIEAYARILSEYPGSLLVTEARARIRLLRGDGV